MGRHSAGDDEDEDLVGGVDVLFADVDEDDAPHTGRHSRVVVPDDTAVPGAAVPDDAVPPVADGPVAAPDGVDSAPPGATTGELPAVDAAPLADTSPAASPAVEAGTRQHNVIHRGAYASAADLALIKRNRALLAGCIGVVVVAFGLYAGVLATIGASRRDSLIWIWVPAVVAGVVVGALLDIAHKRASSADDGTEATTDEATADALTTDGATADAVTVEDAAKGDAAPTPVKGAGLAEGLDVGAAGRVGAGPAAGDGRDERSVVEH